MTVSTWGSKGTAIALSGGNLIATNPKNLGANQWAAVLGSTSQSSGKWYWEIVLGLLPNDGTFNGASVQIGFAKNDVDLNTFLGAGGTDGWLRADMSSFDGSSEGGVSYTTGNRGFTSAVATDVIGFAIDTDAGKLWIAKNNSFGGTPASGTNPAFAWTPSGSWFPAWASNAGSPGGLNTNDIAATIHTSASNQAYSPPSGFTVWDNDAGGGGFQPAWARNSNVIIQPGARSA